MRGKDLQNVLVIAMLTRLDLHKVFVDDADYNDIYGDLYKTCGVSPTAGAIVIVRPDQCK